MPSPIKTLLVFSLVTATVLAGTVSPPSGVPQSWLEPINIFDSRENTKRFTQTSTSSLSSLAFAGGGWGAISCAVGSIFGNPCDEDQNGEIAVDISELEDFSDPAPLPTTNTPDLKILETRFVERVIEETSSFPFIDSGIIARLNELESSIEKLKKGSVARVSSDTLKRSLRNIDDDINNGVSNVVTGGSSDASFSTLELASALAIEDGGTGTSTAPSYGQVLLGNSSGSYDLVATSSLGISGGIADGTFSTSSADYWVIASSTIPRASGSAYGDMLIWNGSAWSVLATSSLGIDSSQWDDISGGINYSVGNVGVGTTSPYAKLSVAGDAVVGRIFATSTGSASSPSVSVGYSNMGLYSQTSSKLDVSIGGSNTHTLWNDGSLYLNNNAAWLYFGNSSPAVLTRSANNTLRLSSDGSSGSADLVVNGKIGVGTTSPYAKLSVAGQIVGEYITSTSTATSTFGGPIQFSSYSSTPQLVSPDGNTGLHFDSSGQISLHNNGTQNVLINSSGNVGIGTSTPTSKFTIVQNSTSATKIFNVASSTGADVFTVDNTGGVTVKGLVSGIPMLQVKDSGGTSRFKFDLLDYGLTVGNWYVSGASSYFQPPSGADIRAGGYANFYITNPTLRWPSSVAPDVALTRNASGVLEITNGTTGVFRDLKLRSLTATSSVYLATSGGYVGIGTTTPAFPLDVYSTVSSNQTYGYLNSSGSVGTSGGTNSYSIRAEGRILASEFNAVSDARLKDVQFELDDNVALEALEKLRPVSFRWKDNPTGQPIIGFLAQEVETAVPNAVSILSVGSLVDQRQLDYNQIVTVSVGAIQALNMKVETLDEMESWSGGVESNSFAGRIVARITEWLGWAGNGIAKIFVGEVETGRLCLSGADGSSTCVTKDQLDAILNAASINVGASNVVEIINSSNSQSGTSTSSGGIETTSTTTISSGISGGSGDGTTNTNIGGGDTTATDTTNTGVTSGTESGTTNNGSNAGNANSFTGASDGGGTSGGDSSSATSSGGEAGNSSSSSAGPDSSSSSGEGSGGASE